MNNQVSPHVQSRRSQTRRSALQRYLVTAEQMQAIEGQLFESGMPVAALMEKVATRLTQCFIRWLASAFRKREFSSLRIGILAGPGHNGGDALVVARELHHSGYRVQIYQPVQTCKPLTSAHARYAEYLGLSFVSSVRDLAGCDVIIDGLFGFGLTRPIVGDLASDVDYLNRCEKPIFSIDLPSGIHTDTGACLGSAIRATHTVCLGLWKCAFMQDSAIAQFGTTELIDFDIPLSAIDSVLGKSPKRQRITQQAALHHLPLDRSPTAHKYTAGHLLLIAGSRQYAGAALLAGLGAIASGVGMLTLAIPESLRLTLLPQLPSALLVGCPESANGAIEQLPAQILENIAQQKYDAIALGPGLTPTVPTLLQTLLESVSPLLLDADALNLLAHNNPIQTLKNRSAPTILTPHLGEFRRLFPDIASPQTTSPTSDPAFSEKIPGDSAQKAAQASGAIVLLKGPRSAIASGDQLWFNPHSTPALARGGSGDVLTGLMGGLVAAAAKESHQSTHQSTHQNNHRSNQQKDAHTASLTLAVVSAVWWHSQAALFASHQRTLLGVDPLTLSRSLNPALNELCSLG
ncbi:MAG: NAD(P)H-hydrate dehydratase [Cyanobacteria bacterium J06627_28]